MCDFQSGTIECRGDGYCWDADNDGYDPDDHNMPCPKCNTKAWLLQQKEEAECCSFYSNMGSSGSGVTIWEHAVEVARRENPEGTDALLQEIGKVEALYEEDGKTLTHGFVYWAPDQQNDDLPPEWARFVYRKMVTEAVTFYEIGECQYPRLSPELWCDRRVCEGFWGSEELARATTEAMNKMPYHR